MSTFQSYSTYQAQPAETEQATSSHASRICGTTNRVSSTDGVISESTSAPDKGNVAECNPWQGSDSFAATARNPNGTPVSELLPTTLVTFDGVQAPVSAWVAQGRLQKAGDGTYAEAQAAPEATQADTADYLPMLPDSMAAVNEALDPVEQSQLDGLHSVGIGVALGTMDARALADRFTQVSGLGGAEGDARLAVIQQAYQAQADHALLSRSGIGAADLPEFYAWAKATHRGALQEAISLQLLQHDVSGYKKLADRWLSATPPSLDAFKAAGVPVRTHTMGSEVFVKGQWMTPSAAAKAGLA